MQKGRPGRRYRIVFAFTEKRELIPGRYSMAIWHGQGKRCAQAFDVIDGPAPAFADTSADTRSP